MNNVRHLLTVTLAISTIGCAQKRVATSLLDAEARLGRGTRVSVLRTDGVQVKGVMENTSANAVRVRTGNGEIQDLAAADVSRITVRDPLWNGLLIGAAVGGLSFAIMGEEGCTSPAAAPDCQRLSRGAGILSFAAIGAGFGVGIDALRRPEVFRAPPRSSLIVTPIASRGRLGILLSRQF